MNRARLARRLLGPTTLVTMLFAASSLHAQAASVDPRFQPWLGCWRPLDAAIGLEELEGEAQPTRACVVPSATMPGSVDLVLFHRDSLLSRTAVPTPGKPLPRKLEECDGTESAEWTPDDSRLVFKADLTCARGIKRVETGMMMMNEAGQWVQLQHLSVGKNEATTVARFRFEGDSALPAGLQVGSLRSTRALRVATGSAVSVDDVINTTRLVSPSLAEAWLAEIGQRFALDAKTLIKLADNGVSPRVIDVMVALANPDRYQLGPAMMNARGVPQGAGIVALNQGRTGRSGVGTRSRCQMMDDFCYGPGGMGAWGLGYRWGMFDPWGSSVYSPFGYGMGWGFNPYLPWGGLGWRNGWGNGWGGGWGGGWGNGVYYGGGPVVIIPSDPGNVGGGAVRGRAVSGGGYTRANPPSSGSSGSGYYPSPSSGAGGGSSSGAGASGGASSGSSDGGRTAKPRGSGGTL
jgi:hypothetical protein